MPSTVRPVAAPIGRLAPAAGALIGLLLGCQEPGDFPTGRGEGSPESEASGSPLLFRPDGTFTIVHFTDVQDDQEMDPRTVRLLEAVLDDQNPDLVVFTGDNVRSGPETPEDVRRAIDGFARPVDSRGIPWLITFGNHDEDHTPLTGVDEDGMLAYYMSFPHNLNQPGPEEVNGTGNMYVLVLGPEGEEPHLVVWLLDSGRYAPDTIAGQSVAGDGLRNYDWIRPSQVSWYSSSSREIEARYGRKVPGLMFFHIPLQEFDRLWENRENHQVVGEKNEDVAAGVFNSGLFGAIMDRGDVMGVFAGHDHVNDYVGDYFGVRLGYSANVGFGTYGLPGDEPDRLRGARVFKVSQEDPAAFETYMVYARDYGIQ